MSGFFFTGYPVSDFTAIRLDLAEYFFVSKKENKFFSLKKSTVRFSK